MNIVLVIGISKLKLDDSVLDGKVNIEGYDVVMGKDEAAPRIGAGKVLHTKVLLCKWGCMLHQIR